MKTTLLVFVTFLIYSFSGVFSKWAAQYDFLSIGYVICLAMVIIVLGIYAILWQKVLGILPLNKAFLCKSITIIYTLIISVFIFEEKITIQNIIGVFCIIMGLIILTIKK